MARYLYRLGIFAARRAWAVIAVWVLLLGLLGASAATLGRPFTNKLTIPGTEFQSVIDDLRSALPAAAGGSGSVVFTTNDRSAFTAAQKQAVADTIKTWTALPGVESAMNPFTTQKQLDDAKTQIAEGATKLADGEKALKTNADRIATGKTKLAEGKQKIEQNATRLADGQDQLAEGEAKLKAGEAKLATAAAKLAAGQRKLDAGRAELVDGQRRLDAGKATWAAGQRELAAGKAQLAEGQRRLDAAKVRLAAGQRELDSGKAQLAQGQRALDAAKAQLASGRNQLDAAEDTIRTKQKHLDASKAALTQGLQQIAGAQQQLQQARSVTTDPAAQAQIDAQLAALAQKKAELEASRPRLAAAQAQLDAARQAIAAKRAKLEPAAKTIASKQAELDAGKAKLAAGQRTLDAGAKTIASKQAELDAGKAKLAAGQRRLDAGAKAIATNQAKLDAGRATLAAGQAELDRGRAQYTTGKAQFEVGRRAFETNKAKLSAGVAALAQGRVDLATAAAELDRGAKRLADAKTTLAEKKVELAQGQRRLALMEGMKAVNTGQNTAVTQVRFDVPMNEVQQATRNSLTSEADSMQKQGVNVLFSQELAQGRGSFMGPGEVVGLLIAGLVLFVMLGSLLAAGLPLLVALVGVATGLLGVVTVTHWWEQTDTTPVLALMLGLAVGIDYALFIVHRHRQQLAQGMPVIESIGRAAGTAGSAVLFAGLTVVIALSALTLGGIPFLGSMGLAAAATVAVSVGVALTLTPALLRLLGQRVLPAKARAKILADAAAEEAEAAAEDAEERGEATRGSAHPRGWGAIVTGHPGITLALSALLLGALAIPAASLKLGLPDASSEASDTMAYRTYSTIADQFGPGQNSAILAVAKISEDKASSLSTTQLTDLQLDVAERLKGVNDVEYVVPASTSADHRTLVFQLVPKTGPSEDATVHLVHDLRDERPALISETGIDSIGFAGQTVANIDISERLAGALPGYLAVVVGISLVLLLLVFRSLVVPVLATAGFLLSIAAAFGSVVAVYQWGWLGPLFGVEHPGLILSFLPTLAIGILFGLAMDYQMFLVSGMREAWSHGHAARTAVRTGFAHGARVVTAAALIMTSVFASFIHSGQTMIRPVGFALAAGVLLDAFVVRMTAMPAIMHLLGDKAWYLPRWLDRILPDLDVEGTSLTAEPTDAHAATTPPPPAPDAPESALV